MPPPYTALVFGGTGASGSALVAALASKPETWGPVIVPVRGDAPPSTSATVRFLPRTDFTRLDPSALGPVDAAFICLGTTRAACGTAEAFEAADLHAPAAAAAAAVAAGARSLGLVSAAGAARGGWAPRARLLHGFLYAATKGAAEEAVLGAGAPSTFLYRPGLLARGESHTAGRPLERWAAALLPSLPVADLAAAMVGDAEAALNSGRAAGEVVVGDREIKAKAAAAAGR